MARGFSRSGRSGGGGGGFSFGGGSRSSGGGFSFGGGRSSSRSSRSYSSSSDYSGGGGYYHRPRRPRGPMHVPMFGRTVVISTGARSVFSIFISILVFAVVIFSIFIGSVFNNADMIEDQRELIAKCERYSKTFEKISTEALKNDDTDNYYLTTVDISDYRTIYYYDDDPDEAGIYVTDIWYNGEKQYFIVYDFDEEVYGSHRTDSTFAEYSYYDIQDLKTSGLKIAYTFKGNELWAINAGYTLEGNAEYQYNKGIIEDNIASNNFNILVCVGSGLVAAAIVTGVVLYLVKQYKKAQKEEAVQDAKDQAAIAEAEAKAEEAQAKADRHNRFCMYCGAQIPPEDDACPACGSRQFDK